MQEVSPRQDLDSFVACECPVSHDVHVSPSTKPALLRTYRAIQSRRERLNCNVEDLGRCQPLQASISQPPSHVADSARHLIPPAIRPAAQPESRFPNTGLSEIPIISSGVPRAPPHHQIYSHFPVLKVHPLSASSSPPDVALHHLICQSPYFYHASTTIPAPILVQT